MADGIIGSVGVAVVPDANAFWTRFREQTQGGASEAGRRAGEDWRRGFNETSGRNEVRVRADTSQARAQIAALNKESDRGGGLLTKLIDTAITLSPALVPLGAAAVAAGAGFVALGGAGLAAFKGLQDQMKEVTPAGIEVAGMLHTLKGGLDELETSAAKGALPGFQESVAKLRADLPQLNDVVSQQAATFGDITSHLTGGIVGGFTTFAPLLNEVSGSVDRIAAHFEAWATGPGGAKFSQALAADYKRVAPIIDDIARGFEHLLVAAHPVGLGVLTELQLLARIVSAFPTPALEAIVAAFISFRAINAVSGVINTVTGAFARFGAVSEAAAVQQTAANLEIQASAATTAAAVAEQQAAEADAVALAQRQIAGSLEGTNSILAESAAAAAVYAEEEAASFRAAALAAQASAAQIGEAAAAAAAESEAAGAVAGAGWSSMLGPVGIAVGAVALLGLTFLNTSKDNQQATKAAQEYATALEQTNGIITNNIRQQVAAKLAQDGLVEAGQKFRLSVRDLTGYVLGDADAQQKVTAAINAQIGPVGKATDGTDNLTGKFRENLRAGGILNDKLRELAKAYGSARDGVLAAEKAVQGYGASTDYTAKQLANGNTAVRGWIASVDTFNKSADTAADRAKLIGAALVAANGDALAYAGSLASATSANNALVDAFKQQAQQLAQQSQQQNTTAGKVTQSQRSAESATARVTAAQVKLNQAWASGTATAAQIQSAQASLTSARNSAANAADRVGAAQTKAAQAQTLAYGDTERAAIKFTGTQKNLHASIDTTAKGAGDLITQLAAIQTAAEGAASATFQHELRLKGAKKAADDAFNVYRSKTQGTLIDEAKQLGLTSGQAHALAVEYFGLRDSGDIKKKIELLGEDKVVRALEGILQDLDILAGKTTVLDIQINAHNRNSPPARGNPVQAPSGPGTGGPVHVDRAAGGFVSGPGTGTSDSINARLSNGEFVMNAAATARNRPALEAMNANYANGGLVRHGDVTVVVPQTINNPVPEPASVSGPAGLRRAAYALGSNV